MDSLQDQAYFEFGDDFFEVQDEENSNLNALNWFTALSLLKDASNRKQCGRAAFAIGSLAAARQYGDILRENGAIELLSSLLKVEGRPIQKLDDEATLEAAANATVALKNLACPNFQNREAIRQAGCIPLLVSLLHLSEFAEDPEDPCSMHRMTCVRAACGTLRNISYANLVNRSAIREAGGIPALAKHIPDPPPAVGSPGREAAYRAGSALCNLCCGCQENVAALWDTGLVPHLVALLSQPGGSGFWHAGFTYIVEYGQENGWLPPDLEEPGRKVSQDAEKRSREAVRRLQKIPVGIQTKWDATKHEWIQIDDEEAAQIAQQSRERKLKRREEARQINCSSVCNIGTDLLV
eukprot:GGOE01036575.1.p1 GENE.GGOE01036575.1~~GGOE01036575.1.p1  ORF type:complete len:352 (-),score=5.62 GGOE01036575.1:22-1077(-)